MDDKENKKGSKTRHKVSSRRGAEQLVCVGGGGAKHLGRESKEPAHGVKIMDGLLDEGSATVHRVTASVVGLVVICLVAEKFGLEVCRDDLA